jgi:Chaperone of endosialidase
MNPSIQLKKATLVFFVALASLWLSSVSTAVSPPPDGGYPGENTAEGDNELLSLTSGQNNTAIGFDALRSDTLGTSNTATGHGALFSNTFGDFNTANGVSALLDNTTGNNNTAVGVGALINNTTGSSNTAIGVLALGNNAFVNHNTGNFNTATGVSALFNNTTGNRNAAHGANALFNNTTGNRNTANGTNAIFRNTTGNDNAANGGNALLLNRTGNGNTASGVGALGRNMSGSFNIALGFNAGANLTTGSDNIDIGALGVAGESNTMRIGTVRQTATYIAGIRAVTTRMANAVPVLIDSARQLGTQSSSQQFKKEIKPIDKASESIHALKPVTFHYKSDSTNTPQFGLIAEEVAKVNSDLVVRDEHGEIYTVRYDAVNVMLLNEFLKEHRKNEEQEATIARQQKQIEALTAGLQKVSAQLAASKPAPQIVLNHP